MAERPQEEEPLTQADLEAVLQSLAARLNAPQGEGALAQRLFHPVRWQHFSFVHQYLADRLEWESDNSLEDLLRSDSPTQRLRELWVSVGQKVKPEGEAWIPADELECFPFHPNEKHWGIIIQFPQPQMTCEAYLAAIVFAADLRVRDYATYYRYFLLELGWELDGTKRTVLCERCYSRHYSYGSGCEPDKEAFAQLLREKFFGPEMFAPELDLRPVG